MTQRVGGRAWLVVAMLFLFMLINFADKAVLGLAATPIIRELKLTHTEFGRLGSSFFLAFSLSAVLVGFLSNRVATRWTLAGMALVWGLAQLPMGFVAGVDMLFANRMVLGAGEGPAFPVALHAIYKWFPDRRRPLPTSLVGMGGAVGAGIAAPAITFVILHYSWRAAFALLGVLGLAWAVVWLTVGREGPLSEQPAAGAAAPRAPYAVLLTSRTVVGGVVIAFSAYWLLTLAVVWLPNYLHVVVGYSLGKVAWVVALPSLVQIAVVPQLCLLSERLSRSGVSSRWARGGVGAACVAAAGALTFLLPAMRGTVAPAICAALAFSLGSAIFSLSAVLVAEITPAAQRGALLGVNNACATLAGVFAPVTMGMIVDAGATSADGFRFGFRLVGVAVVAAAVVGGLLIDPDADLKRLARRLSSAAPHPSVHPTSETRVGAAP